MSTERGDAGPSTQAIHADHEHNPTSAVAPAIFQTATYRWDAPEAGPALAAQHAPAQFYARHGSPNVRQLEAIVAALEGSESALAVASGMAAATLSVVPFVKQGDHIVGARTLYGEVNALLTKVLPRFGVESTIVNSTRAEDYAAAVRANTVMIVTETPANPTLDCVDLVAVASVARARGVRLVVDNTFATPINTKPLALGAHTVFHSATKYLAGHSDVLAGVIASDRETIAKAWEQLRVYGSVLGPFEAWLVTRGLRTFPLRMARHNDNGLQVATYLAQHPRVTRVNYPGIASHASHAVASKQMKGFGAVLSIELDGGEAAARRFVTSLKLFALAPSLGGVESLVMYPASLSGLSAERLLQAGIAPGLVRLAVGCEDPEDLLADLAQALG